MLRKFAGFVSAAGLVVCVACGQTDAGITTNVKTKLAADDTVKAYQVDVDTHNRVVTLTGAVDSPAAKLMAVRIARDTEGVSDVIDQIVVNETAATSGVNDPNDRVDVDVDKRGVDVDVDNRVEADVKEGARDTRNAAERAGDATADGAKKVGSATADGAKKVGQATVTGAKKVGSAIKGAVTDDDRDSDRDGR
jgi:hypothetical protein